MNHNRITLSALAIAIGLAACDTQPTTNPVDNLEPAPKAPSIYVQPVSNLGDAFIMGVDISTLLEVEANGGRYFNENGIEEDLFAILERKGVNWVRLRLWNDPYDVSWINTEWSDYGSTTGPAGGGTNDLAKTIALATRAKAAGMKVLLDFHYSDFWADPGKQYIPDAWKDLVVVTGETEQLGANGQPLTDASGATLMTPTYDCSAVETSLYDFTKDSLVAMDQAGVFPEMVQVGNEINNGLVYPCGKWTTFREWTYAGGIALLQAGIDGVEAAEEATGKDTEIMLHFAEGGHKTEFEEMFTAFDDAGLSYDIIGASYYPMWHGSLAGLQENLNNISAVTGKKVMVAEVSYAFTNEGNDDPTPNSFSESDVAKGKFLATVQGQATAIREVINVLAQVPNNLGTGIFYWEPAWIPVPGAGWISGEGNGWENQAMFDYDGNALESLDVFKRVASTESVALPTIASSSKTDIAVNAGATVELPETLDVVYSDDAIRPVKVTWSADDIDAIDNLVPGSYQVTGTTESGFEVSANVIVLENVLENSSFENASLTPWTTANSSTFFSLYKTADANVFEGVQSLSFWCPTVCSDRITQSLAVENGVYVVSAVASGESKGDSTSALVANDQSAAISLTGWAQWKESSVTVTVTDGILSVSIDLNEAAESWGYIDIVRAIRQ